MGMTDITWVNIALWLASGLVFAAFFMRAITPLRCIAIASNIAFVIYAVGAWNVPILVLHIALLPLNLLRILQHRSLLRQVRRAAEGGPHIEKLVPLMERRFYPVGTLLFRQGDQADAMFVLLSGTVEFPEPGITISPGTLFGEMALFLSDKRRTASAICMTDCEIGSLSGDRIKELVMLDPAFGLSLTRMIASRMNENNERLSMQVCGTERTD